MVQLDQEQHQPDLKVAVHVLVKPDLEDMAMVAAANTIIRMHDQCSSSCQQNSWNKPERTGDNASSSMAARPAQHQLHHQHQQGLGASAPESPQQPKSSYYNNSTPEEANQTLAATHQAHHIQQTHHRPQDVGVVLAAARELLLRRQRQRHMQKLASIEQLRQQQQQCQQLLPQQQPLRQHLSEHKRTREAEWTSGEPQAKRYQPILTKAPLEQKTQQQQQLQQHINVCTSTSASSTSHGAVCAEPVSNGAVAPLTTAVFRTVMHANELLHIAVEHQLVAFEQWQPVACRLLDRQLALPCMTELHKMVWLGTFATQVKMYYNSRPAALTQQWAAGLMKLLQVM